MELLRVRGLSKNFGGLKVLQDLSFTLDSGEKVALIGPNGAGKTTLLNVLGGQLPATGGEIYFRGREVTTLAPHRRLHLGIARSFQLNNLFLNLTIEDNVLLALQGAERGHFQMYRPLKGHAHLLAKSLGLLKSMDLWEKRLEPMSSLPYGDQRRAEVALSLASAPKLLLLDEPSAGLSMAESAVLISALRDLPEGSALFFSAHDMDLVFNFADRIMVLYFGQMVAQGTPQEIQANPRVKEIYLGSETT